MNYEESIEWLNTIPLSFDRNNKNYEFKLDGIKAFLSHLDNPHSKLKIIHVGGTNGKGSTCSIISSILQESGYKIGAFTSPHIKDYRERIRIGKNFIEKDFILEFIRTNNLKIEELGLTYFEISFAMAIDYFATKKVDYTILEVGLGGRLDATNIVKPIISVITNIGHDHKKFLGNTLEKIAVEKAGIIKQNVPVVIGEKRNQLKKIFLKIAKEKSTSINFPKLYYNYKSDLIGPYQSKNISVALCVIKQLELEINQKHINLGLLRIKQNTKLFGRWEIIKKNPLLIFDAAHNIDALKETLNSLKPGSKIVFGTLDKIDQLNCLDLFPKNYHYYLCSPNVNRAMGVDILKDQIKCLEIFPKTMFYYFCPVNSPRTASVLKLCNKAKKIDLKYFCFESVESALKTAYKDSKKNENILVTGSTFLFKNIIKLKL